MKNKKIIFTSLAINSFLPLIAIATSCQNNNSDFDVNEKILGDLKFSNFSLYQVAKMFNFKDFVLDNKGEEIFIKPYIKNNDLFFKKDKIEYSLKNRLGKKFAYQKQYWNVNNNKIEKSITEQKFLADNLFFHHQEEYKEYFKNYENFKNRYEDFLTKVKNSFIYENSNYFVLPEIQSILDKATRFSLFNVLEKEYLNIDNGESKGIRSLGFINSPVQQQIFKKNLDFLLSQYSLFSKDYKRIFDHSEIYLEKDLLDPSILKIKVDLLDKNNESILEEKNKDFAYILKGFKYKTNYQGYKYFINDDQVLFNEYLAYPKLEFNNNLLNIDNIDDLFANLKGEAFNLNSLAFVKMFHELPNLFKINYYVNKKEDQKYEIENISEYFEPTSIGLQNTRSLAKVEVKITRNNQEVLVPWYSSDFDFHGHLLSGYFNSKTLNVSKNDEYGYVKNISNSKPIAWPKGVDPIEFFNKNITNIFNFYVHHFKDDIIFWKNKSQKEIENFEIKTNYQDTIKSLEFMINSYFSKFIFDFNKPDFDNKLHYDYIQIKFLDTNWFALPSGTIHIKFEWNIKDKKSKEIISKIYSSDVYEWCGFKGTNFKMIDDYEVLHNDELKKWSKPHDSLNIPYLNKK